MDTYHKQMKTSWAHCGRIITYDQRLVVILEEICSFEIDLKEARMMLLGMDPVRCMQKLARTE